MSDHGPRELYAFQETGAAAAAGDEVQGMSAEAGQREPDAEAIGVFVRTLFAYADEASYVSLRAFFQLREGPPPYIRGSLINGSGLNSIIDDAVAGARFAANYREPLVFAPPVATFRCAKKADEISLINGLAISVELDQGNTTEARARLEGLLGVAKKHSRGTHSIAVALHHMGAVRTQEEW